MNQIPPLAWIAIIAIVLITIAVNYGMVALLRNRGEMKNLTSKMQARKPSRTVQTIQEVKEILSDPFGKEREQINELSRLVSNLNEPPASREDSQSALEKHDPPETK